MQFWLKPFHAILNFIPPAKAGGNSRLGYVFIPLADFRDLLGNDNLVVFFVFIKIKSCHCALKVSCSARGMGASYQSNAYSPTAFAKGATKRYCILAPFANGVLPKFFHIKSENHF
jgi:hypothetical protein